MRSATGAILGLFCAVYLLTFKGMTTGDDFIHYDLVQNFCRTGRLCLPESKYDLAAKRWLSFFAARGQDGRVYMTLPHGMAVASIPLGFVGQKLDEWVGVPPIDPFASQDVLEMQKGLAVFRQRPSALLTTSVNPLASAALVAVFFAFSLRISGAFRDALFSSLLLGLATIVWPYSATYWTQPLAALCLFLSLFVVVPRTGTRWAFTAGLLAGAAVLSRYEMLLFVPWLVVPSIVSSWRARRLAVHTPLLFLCGLLCALALQGAWNAYRFGSWLTTMNFYQSTRTFRGDLLNTLPLLVFSPFRGALVYSPPLVLGAAGLVLLFRRDGALAVVLGGVSLTALVLYGSLGMWHDEMSWGPRFLVPVTPFLLLPACLLVRRWRRVTWALFAVGALIQLVAVLGPYDFVAVSTYLGSNSWTPATYLRPPFWVSEMIPQLLSVLHGNVEFWWLASPVKGLLGAALFGLGTLCVWQLWSHLRSSESASQTRLGSELG